MHVLITSLHHVVLVERTIARMNYIPISRLAQW